MLPRSARYGRELVRNKRRRAALSSGRVLEMASAAQLLFFGHARASPRERKQAAPQSIGP